MRERLVEITREAYGLVHPSTAYSIKNLVALLREIGDHAAAEQLIQEFLVRRAPGEFRCLPVNRLAAAANPQAASAAFLISLRLLRVESRQPD
jgi:hypothetical protein